MKITLIADTHGMHELLCLTEGDMLIHAGDITEYGSVEEVMDFIGWFAKQPFKYKIFIAGNHDLFLESCSAVKRKRFMPHGVTYLQNSSIEIEGLKIFGSPVTPYYLGMAFNKREGKEIKKCWDKIPVDTNILITHGPPKGIMDNGFGCETLMNKLTAIKPILHVFGHVHEQNGSLQQTETCFVNAALVNCLDPFLNRPYRIIAKPIDLILDENIIRIT